MQILKIFFLVIFFPNPRLQAQEDIHSYKLSTFSAGTFDMATAGGHKKLIVTESLSKLRDSSGLVGWDSLGLLHPDLRIIIIPLTDSIFGLPESGIVPSLGYEPRSGLSVCSPALRGHPDSMAVNGKFLYWLTQPGGNGHFSTALDLPGNLFIVSESGILYAVLPKGSPSNLLEEVLAQQDVNQ